MLLFHNLVYLATLHESSLKGTLQVVLKPTICEITSHHCNVNTVVTVLCKEIHIVIIVGPLL